MGGAGVIQHQRAAEKKKNCYMSWSNIHIFHFSSLMVFNDSTQRRRVIVICDKYSISSVFINLHLPLDSQDPVGLDQRHQKLDQLRREGAIISSDRPDLPSFTGYVSQGFLTKPQQSRCFRQFFFLVRVDNNSSNHTRADLTGP